MKTVKKHFEEASRTLELFMHDEEQMKKVALAGALMAEAFNRGKKVISCGNGGSMCDAMHFAEELSGKFREERKPLPAMSISDPSYLTCTANDFGFSEVFSRYVIAHGSEGDVLLAITTSGNSGNVLKAMEAARNQKMHIVALTGKDGGKAAKLADIEIRAPHTPYADRAQEIHIKVIHSLIDQIEQGV